MQDKIKHIFEAYNLSIGQPIEKKASDEPLEKKAADVLKKINEALNVFDVEKVASGISDEENMILRIVKDFQNL